MLPPLLLLVLPPLLLLFLALLLLTPLLLCGAFVVSPAPFYAPPISACSSCFGPLLMKLDTQVEAAPNLIQAHSDWKVSSLHRNDDLQSMLVVLFVNGLMHLQLRFVFDNL